MSQLIPIGGKIKVPGKDEEAEQAGIRDGGRIVPYIGGHGGTRQLRQLKSWTISRRYNSPIPSIALEIQLS
jgi:hypothetical protein